MIGKELIPQFCKTTNFIYVQTITVYRGAWLLKQSVLILLSILLLVFSSTADLDIQVLTPGDIDWTGLHSLYELTSKVVRIDFLKSNQSQLLQANITVMGATINSVVQGSTCTVLENLVTCGDIDILRLNITASNVAATTNFDWDVKAIDSDSGLVAKTLQLEVVNDGIAPRYTLNAPAEYALVQNTTTLFNTTPLELESGFNSARMYYDYYPTIGSSTVLGESAMVCGTSCTAQVTLTPSLGNYYFGYFFNLTDKAGNANTTSTHWLYVDAFAPQVAATTPADNIHINVKSYNYGFTIQENSFGIDPLFAPQVGCSLYIDSTFRNTTTLTANATVTLASSLSGLAEGSHSWYATCVDSAGWGSSTASRTFVLDTTGPVIMLASPANNSVINTSRFISLSVSDALSNVSSVWYTDQNGVNQTLASPTVISTAGWPEGSFLLNVYANDSLNNPSSAVFTFVVDITGPGITFLSPVNNTYNNSGVFRFSSTDANGGTVTCTLMADGAEIGSSQSLVSGSTFSFTASLADGVHTWGGSCVDQVGNGNALESRTVLVDTIAPVVSLLGPSNGTNLAGAANFTFSVAELNTGTGACTLYINGTAVVSTIGYANFTVGSLNPSNDIQNWKVDCWDAANNIGSSSTRQVYYDIFAPTLSGIGTSGRTTTSVTISWNVDESSTNTVFYGTNNASLSSNKNAALVNTTPRIELNSLTASTLYYFRVQSCDQWNSCRNSTLNQFTTETAAAPGFSSGGGGGGGGGSTQKVECNDGKDNDKDGKVDGSDPGCSGADDDDEKDPSSSSSGTESCQENWKCDAWTECANGVQTRSCEDRNSCGTSFVKPEVQRECASETPTVSPASGEGPASGDTASQGNALTGAVIGALNKVKSNAAFLAGLVSLVAVAGLALWKREFLRSRMVKLKPAHQEEEKIQEQLRKGGIIR